jgi:hypothetical protein
MSSSLESRVRAICGAFPEVTERLSHGSPAELLEDAYRAIAPKTLLARLDAD